MIEGLDVLKQLAFEEMARQSENHGLYKLSKAAKDSWQAHVLRDAHEMTIVWTPEELRMAVRNPKALFIFIPADAMLTHEAAKSILSNSVLQKSVILEYDGENGLSPPSAQTL